VKTHPYADAIYEIVPLAAGGFGVKISIQDISPTTVSRFDNAAAAEAWIESHKSRIRAQARSGMIFRKSSTLPDRRRHHAQT
jgi:hypothetical protein